MPLLRRCMRRLALPGCVPIGFSAVAVLVVTAAGAFAQSAAEGRKQAQTIRVDNGAVRLDGRLDEGAWRAASPITDFVQKEPVEGAPPGDPLDVRIVYDDDAIYIGARMHSSVPVRAPLGRRDNDDQAEHIVVSLDTYLDRRTASSFGITAAGVRLDRYYASDDDSSADRGYNPVWSGEVSTDDTGWTAEMRIPFSQLRFNDRSPQVWGLNIERRIPARNEEVFWALVPRTERKWASLFGDLHGIDGIRPRRRLELLPYVAGASQIVGERDLANPFVSAANLDGRVGLDLKMGLGSNLTLEATVNPDFGQVEADPAEVNLSAVETFFSERRPFFLEGSDLLSGFVNNYFYSRRIGATPAERASGDFVDRPRAATILGAAKLTGRLKSGTSIGVLSAVTGEESARSFSAGSGFDTTRVAPRTVSGVARVEQEFGPPGSTVGVMSTFLHRDLSPGDPLASLLTTNAVTLSSDAIVRLRNGEYEWRGYLGGSRVTGEAGAIDRIQRSSAHYFQRPDALYFGYDPTRTSLTGIKTGTRIERRTGQHWNWRWDAEMETAGFETNDTGRLTSADGPQTGAQLSYRETVPGSWYRNYFVQVRHQRNFTYDGIRRAGIVESFGSITWPNFWETDVEVVYNMRAQDERLTRGGPLMGTPRSWNVAVSTENSQGSRTRADGFVEYGRDEDGALDFRVGTEWEFQPGAQWRLSVEPTYRRQVDVRQYIATLGGGPEETFGNRYVFSRVDRSTYATQFRANYTFKPDLTLDLYAEPFAASGRYSDFGELLAPQSRFLRLYGTGATTATVIDDGSIQVADGSSSFVLRNRDFHRLSFRSNLVLRWEWRPGSTLFVVWQQDRAADEIGDSRATAKDMFNALRANGDNFFVVKASFWFAPN
jgi:hypothetical protein